MLSKQNLNEALADAVMDRPREFFIDEERFCLWRPTLGQSLMLERQLLSLGLDPGMLSGNPAMEAMRLVAEARETVCRILAILSFRSYAELSDSRLLKQRAEMFSAKLEDDELAQLILFVLSEPGADSFISLSGVADDQRELSRISQLKNKDGNSLSFGGKTIYGLLIDAACRAYGWTKEYVVWGIDLVSLRMMMADTVNSVYLTDKEAETLHIGGQREEIGMGGADFEKLRNMDWN